MSVPHHSPYGEAIAANPGFYRDWLLVKLYAYCDFKGWERPLVEALARADRARASILSLPTHREDEKSGKGQGKGGGKGVDNGDGGKRCCVVS